MTHLARSWAASFALAALCFVASGVRAHAPIPRRVVLTPDGSAIALSLPGFGLVFRARPDRPFAYLCDALLGLRPSDAVPSLAFLSDGSLLLGSADGVRSVGPDGCPRALGGELASASVIALAVVPGTPEIAYAIASGNAAGLWQSHDGGKHWELRTKLEHAELTNALVVQSSDPDQVYLSLWAGSTDAGAAGPTLLATTDGGAALTSFLQTQALTLLSADGRAPYPLWAIARDALTVGNRGLAILRAEGPSGPWVTVLRVNYFGGFLVDADGVIWIGDEIGGIYRSSDGGDSFTTLEQDADVGCLASAAGALWACTPGTTEAPALQRISVGQPRTDVVALAAVDRLVACPDLDVSQSCATAWVEWQRDVRLMPPSQDAGTGALADAGPSADAADAMAAESVDDVLDAAPTTPPSTTDAAALPPHAARSACSLRPASNAASAARQTRLARALSWLMGLLLALRLRDRHSGLRARDPR